MKGRITIVTRQAPEGFQAHPESGDAAHTAADTDASLA